MFAHLRPRRRGKAHRPTLFDAMTNARRRVHVRRLGERAVEPVAAWLERFGLLGRGTMEPCGKTELGLPVARRDRSNLYCGPRFARTSDIQDRLDPRAR